MIRHNQRLREIINLGIEIGKYKDIDLLLERVLSVAREFVEAEAGSIYIREKDQLRFSHTQNDALQRQLPPGKKLIYTTFSMPINSESVAGYVARSGEILNIHDAYSLPGNAPYSFDRGYDELSGYRTKSVFTVPLKTHHGDVVGVLQLINARGKDGQVKSFSKREEPFIEHFANIVASAIERAQLTRAIILRVIKMAELRDPKETGRHVERVASYAIEIYEEWAQRRGVAAEEIERNKDVLKIGAMLHDVGKVAISDLILKKPGRLNQDEYEIMKQHTYLGARLFSEMYSDFDEAASIVALNHHEHWDGNGYPGHVNPVTGKPIAGYETARGNAKGKRAEEIPPFGRVVAIADVYDALCSTRVYKESWDEPQVLSTLREDSGKQFDPEMIDAFFARLDVIRNIGNRYPEQ